MAPGIKNSPANAGDIKRHGFNPRVGKILRRRKWQPTPVFLPGESPWTEEPGGLQSMGRKESDTTGSLSTRTSGDGSTPVARGPQRKLIGAPWHYQGCTLASRAHRRQGRCPRRTVPALMTDLKVWSPSALGRLAGRGPFPAVSLALNR